MSKYDYLLKVPEELLKILISKMDYSEIKEILDKIDKSEEKGK